MGFKDYRKRSVILKENVFKSHTSGKYVTKNEIRHQLFPYIETVLKSPNEVWISNKTGKKLQLNYIKYYQDMAIVVPVIIDNNGYMIASWFKMKNEKDVRTGYLTRRKE